MAIAPRVSPLFTLYILVVLDVSTLFCIFECIFNVSPTLSLYDIGSEILFNFKNSLTDISFSKAMP